MMIGVFMKKIAIVLFAITPTLFAQSQQPHGLMCEMLAMPEKTKIMDATPEFGRNYEFRVFFGVLKENAGKETLYLDNLKLVHE